MFNSKDAFERWNVAGELRRYPWESAAAFILRASVIGDYRQTRYSAHTRSDVDDSSGTSSVVGDDGRAVWTYRYIYSYGGSIVLGRVRDATGVYQAYLLERRLIETGALTGPLTAAARNKIAALFYIEPRYAVVHDRPGRFFWRDLERILTEDGTLRETGLDAYTVLRALELYGGRSALKRPVGFFVGLTATGLHGRDIARGNSDRQVIRLMNDSLIAAYYSTQGARYALSSDEVQVGGETELHYPAGMRTQVDFTSRLLFPTRDFKHGMNLQSTATFVYLIADRWKVATWTSHSRATSRAFPSRSGWLVDYGAQLDFYLEDRILITLSARESQRRQVEFFPRYGTYNRDGRISLGISYHFLGGLDAPGLIEPQRLIPPSPSMY